MGRILSVTKCCSLRMVSPFAIKKSYAYNEITPLTWYPGCFLRRPWRAGARVRMLGHALHDLGSKHTHTLTPARVLQKDRCPVSREKVLQRNLTYQDILYSFLLGYEDSLSKIFHGKFLKSDQLARASILSHRKDISSLNQLHLF